MELDSRLKLVRALHGYIFSLDHATHTWKMASEQGSTDVVKDDRHATTHTVLMRAELRLGTCSSLLA